MYRAAVAPVQQIRKVSSPMTKNGHIRAQPKPVVTVNYVRPTVRSKMMRLCSLTNIAIPSYQTKRMLSPKLKRLVDMFMRDEPDMSLACCWKRTTMTNGTRMLTHQIRRMHRRPLHSGQKIKLRYDCFAFIFEENTPRTCLFLFCSMLTRTTIFRVRIICHITI